LYLLHDVEGTLQARFASLVTGGVTFEDLQIKALSDARSVQLDPIAAGVAGGELLLLATIGKADSPPVSLRLAMREVQAGELLDAMGFPDRLSGTGSVDVDLVAVGTEYDEIVANLDGDVSINLRDGRIHGIDIGRILAAARGGGSESGSDTESGSDELQTPFSSFTADFRFDDGVGKARETQLSAPDFLVQGDGEIDLPRDHVDFRLAFHLAKVERNEVLSSAPEFEPVPIPLRVRGPLAEPQVSLDMEALMKTEAEGELLREAERRGIDAPSGRDALREYLRRGLERRLD
jgi:AsmA protein